MLLLLPDWEHQPVPWFGGGWKWQSLVLVVAWDSSVVPSGVGRGAWRSVSKHWADAEQGQGFGGVLHPSCGGNLLACCQDCLCVIWLFLVSQHCFLCSPSASKMAASTLPGCHRVNPALKPGQQGPAPSCPAVVLLFLGHCGLSLQLGPHQQEEGSGIFAPKQCSHSLQVYTAQRKLQPSPSLTSPWTVTPWLTGCSRKGP